MQNLLLGAAALACPIGMGLMMLLMARGTRKRTADPPPDPAAAAEIAQLRVEVAQLKAEQSPIMEPHRG
jgi:hypothetical protein